MNMPHRINKFSGRDKNNYNIHTIKKMSQNRKEVGREQVK
jgi:hypothetical protein